MKNCIIHTLFYNFMQIKEILEETYFDYIKKDMYFQNMVFKIWVDFIILKFKSPHTMYAIG